MIFQQRRILLPWTHKNAFASLLESSSAHAGINTSNIADALHRWDIASHKLSRLAKEETNIHHSIQSKELDTHLTPRLDHLLQDKRFLNVFRSRDYDFRMVELDKLVTHQNSVKLGYNDIISARLPQQLTPEDILDTCFALEKETAHVSELRPDFYHYLYSSDSSDFRLTEIISKPVEEVLNKDDLLVGIPERVLMVVVGYGIPVVTGFKVGKQILLNNGFHRLHVLRARGITHAPMLVLRDASEQEIASLCGMPADSVMREIRPPLLKDFFDAELTFDLHEKARKRVIRISINQEVIDVPL